VRGRCALELLSAAVETAVGSADVARRDPSPLQEILRSRYRLLAVSEPGEFGPRYR